MFLRIPIKLVFNTIFFLYSVDNFKLAILKLKKHPKLDQIMDG